MGQIESILGSSQATETITLLDSGNKAGAAGTIFSQTTGKITVERQNLHGKRAFRVQELYLENDNDITQGAGGAMANPDVHVQRITYSKFHDMYQAIKNKDLAAVTGYAANKMGHFWKAYRSAGQHRNFVALEEALVGVSSQSDILQEIPLYEAFPGDPNREAYGLDLRMLDTAKYELRVDAASNVDSNISAMVDRWKLKARGFYSDDIIIPPRVSYEYWDCDSDTFKEFAVGGANGTLLMVALFDTSDTLERSTDYITIENDGSEILKSTEKTIGELFRERKAQNRHVGISPFASSGTVSGITNSYVNERNFLMLIDPANKLSRRLHPKRHLKITKGSTYASGQFRFLVARAIPHDRIYLNQVCQRLIGANFPGGQWIMADKQTVPVNLAKDRLAVPVLVNA